MTNEITVSITPAVGNSELPKLPIELVGVRLISHELATNALVESQKKSSQPYYEIGCFVRDVDIEGDVCISFIDIEVMKYLEGESAGAITATYIVSAFAKYDRDTWISHLSTLAATAIWGRFASLFSLVMDQSALRWPPLPLVPPSVRRGKDLIPEEVSKIKG